MAPEHYPRDTAGHMMVEHAVKVDPHMTLHELHEKLTKELSSAEVVEYIYVVDEWGKFVGVLSLKDLARHDKTQRCGEVCKRDQLVSVHPQTHQERVAYLALRHNLKAMPVIDDDHRFLGVIPGTVILKILFKETHEDLLRLAGVPHAHMRYENMRDVTVFHSLLHRIPWLFIGLVGGLFAAKLIGAFEQTLERNIILAAFIPLIVYMSDAVGTQMEAFIIRDLAIDRRLKFAPYFLKQFLVTASIGVLFGGVLFVSAATFYDDVHLAAVLSLALCAAVASSVCTGLCIPYLFSRLRLDPANASGPIGTILQDLLSVLIYFSIATLLL